MKRIHYSATWFEVGPGGYSEAKYKAGQDYPVTEETLRHAARGIAKEIDVPDAPPVAEESSAADVVEAAPVAAEAPKATVTPTRRGGRQANNG